MEKLVIKPQESWQSSARKQKEGDGNVCAVHMQLWRQVGLSSLVAAQAGFCQLLTCSSASHLFPAPVSPFVLPLLAPAACLSGYCYLLLICRPLLCENWEIRGRASPPVLPVMLQAPVKAQLNAGGLMESSHVRWGCQIWTWHLEHTLPIAPSSRVIASLWMGLFHHLCLPLWYRKVMFKVAQVTWGYLRTWGTSPIKLNIAKILSNK